VVERGSQPLIEALGLVAPGRPLREGLDRILQADRGALVVVGDDPGVLSICTGGFLLDAEFSPQRLSELAKMDGAIILAADASRIARANVHLVPRASVPTRETGTRHRTAERVARSLDVPVITVSESMSTIAVYRNDRKRTLQRTGRVVDRASQALQTLQRFKDRFDVAVTTLSSLELEDTVTLRDVVAVLQPGERVLRIAEEIQSYLVELGEDGRLIQLQLVEMVAGAAQTLDLVVADYAPATLGARAEASDGAGRDQLVARAVRSLRALSSDDLLDPSHVASALGMGTTAEGLDVGMEPRGYRLLHRVPRISEVIVDRIVDRFATLPDILAATPADLERVDGVGSAKARSVKDGLARIVEASILERYD
jgi:diadenylate cyclase